MKSERDSYTLMRRVLMSSRFDGVIKGSLRKRVVKILVAAMTAILATVVIGELYGYFARILK